MMHYIIDGNPIPLARARMGSRRMYDSQKDLKIIHAINLQNQHGEKPMYNGPLHLDVTFFLRMPKVSMRKSTQMNHTYHHYKPDLSNLVKFVEDIANHIIYNDDAQIACITSRKIYHENPHTEFIIKPLRKDDKYENLST